MLAMLAVSSHELLWTHWSISVDTAMHRFSWGGRDPCCMFMCSDIYHYI